MARQRFNNPNDSFDAKYEVSDSGCWFWTGHVDKKGYGVIGVGNRKLMKAHRFSYERFNGPIIPGMFIDHLCRTRNCVNPDHLDMVTNRLNVIRGHNARPAIEECKRGHPFNEQNTYINPKGNRECKTCRNEAAARQRQRRTYCAERN